MRRMMMVIPLYYLDTELLLLIEKGADIKNLEEKILVIPRYYMPLIIIIRN